MKEIEIGQKRLVQLSLTSGATVRVEAVVEDSRKNFGRVDWLVAVTASPDKLWLRVEAFAVSADV